MMGVQ